jgi:hypothetical protein
MSGGRRVLIAATVAIALATTACGWGESTAKKPQGRDLTAVECPMVQRGPTRYEPARNAFDTAALVGMKLPGARAKAAAHGCEIVVSSKDGRGRPVPIEIDPTRSYVFTEDGVVTYIEGVGGGI